MEIVSIPLYGDLEHKDSMGNITVISEGEIQVMSAGTGILHSEYNKNKDKEVKFLQIWIQPNKKNVTPRYDQKKIQKKKNCFEQILSPHQKEDGVWIHQEAWFHIGVFDKNFKLEYNLKKNGNGVYIFVLNGDFEVEGFDLSNRDAMGISNTDSISFHSKNSASRILLMEVPMKF